MNRNAERHLVAAQKLLAKGDDYYGRAADEIVAAREADPGLTTREIGAWFGHKESWVRQIVAWRKGGAAASAPFARPGDPGKRGGDRAIIGRAEPDVIVEAISKAPASQRRQIVEGLVSDEGTRSEVFGALDRRTPAAPKAKPRPVGIFQVLMELRRIKKDVRSLAELVVDGDMSGIDTEQRQSMREMVDWLRNALELIASSLEDGDLDEAFAELLGES